MASTRLLRSGGVSKSDAEVPGEDLDGVAEGFLGQLLADFAFQARQDEVRQCVVHERVEQVAVRVVGQVEVGSRGGLDAIDVPVELHLEDVLLLPAIDRQDAVRRDGPKALGELEVVAVLLALLLVELRFLLRLRRRVAG